MMTHMAREGTQCEICDFTTRAQHLGSHMKLVHGLDLSYECKICLRVFVKKKRLQNHLKKHFLKTLGKFQNSGTKSENAKIFQHSKQNYRIEYTPSPGNYECEICRYQTAFKGHYDRHMMAHVEKKFKCNRAHCDYETNIKFHMETHEKFHKSLEEKMVGLIQREN